MGKNTILTSRKKIRSFYMWPDGLSQYIVVDNEKPNLKPIEFGYIIQNLASTKMHSQVCPLAILCIVAGDAAIQQ